MKAGRELDALVAEKVMGTKRPGRRCPGYPVAIQLIEGGDMWQCRVCDKTGFSPRHTNHRAPSLQYSTSIADAWLVVEKMKETHWHAFIIALVAPHVGADRVPLNVFAQTLFDLTAERICLAALKACGVEEK